MVESQNGAKIHVDEDVNKVKSPLTGLPVDENKINKRVIAVMFDNQSKARPQAGISQCDIVYEILAEGNITRYMGILGTEQPANIGPIRSARDYFIERALEYDSLYVHVGGSPQAYQAIKDDDVSSVNGMNQGSQIFWRKSHKKAPHNMYSSYEAILKGAAIKKYAEEGHFDQLSFLDTDSEISGEKLLSIKFPYDGSRYCPSYQYNEQDKMYHRYINGKPQLDENGNVPIVTKNIIVQFTKTQAISGDKAGRLTVEMVGEGNGYYITDGKYREITWRKDSIYDLTRYYDQYGNQISLNPGKIWIQVFPQSRADQIVDNMI